MRRAIGGIVVLLCLGMAHVLLLDHSGSERQKLTLPQEHGYVLPGPMLRVAVGEYRGVAADFFFLQGL